MSDTLNIEAGKEYLLRNGQLLRCYATDGGGAQPIHGAYRECGKWQISEWSTDGRWCGTSKRGMLDIISEAPPSIDVECWLWVYKNGEVQKFGEEWTDTLAQKFRDNGWTGPIAQIHIKRTVVHGEGLDQC